MASLQGLLFIFLFLFIATLVQGQCPSPQYVDGAPPAGPSFASYLLSDALTPVVDNYNPLTENHYSEKANLAAYRAPKVTPTHQQTECPHKRSGLKNWHDTETWGGAIPSNNADVTIPPNTQVLIASCSIDPSFILGIITIPPTSALIFSDANISINARGFNVRGALYAGSQTCRLRSKVTITLHGRRSNQKLPAAEQVKGIAVTGSIDFHGVQYTPTWTRLAMTAKPNDTWIFVQDRVNWQPGQLIVITTTELKDSRDWHRNEERRILATRTTKLGDSVTAIQIDSPLSYKHFGGREYQAEVSLLSRNILVQGDPTNSEPTDDSPVACSHTNTQSSTYPCENSFLTGFGAHIIVYGNTSQGRFSGVEVFRGGQTNVLGRYPIHFHLMGDQTSFNYTSAYAQDCSVHHSYFRCFAIHGSHGVRLSENTAYNAIGHCFFLEDGVEENNIMSFNQAAHIHPLGPYQNPSLGLNGDGWGGQFLSYYNQTDNLILPSDMAAGCFYITNNYNDFIGNAASGGWAGFSMPALPLPVKLFVNTTGLSPANRPFRTPFRGNSAHSSGFWWATAGGIYVGGELTQPGGFLGNLTYTSGRSSVRNTCTVKDSSKGCNRNDFMWLRFEDNKVFLSNRGMQNWGNRAEIVRFELHDVSLAMNVFGRVWIDSMLMECRTLNHQPTWLAGCPTAPAQSRNPPSVSARCNIRDYTFWNTFGGFQWYDVGQMHILTDSTFRNCRNDWTYCFGSAGNCSNTAVFTSLTHSDQFVPELMQITSGIKYENVTDLWRYSTALSYKGGITVSGRLQNWLDYDGTASQMGSRAMIGSARANDWWKYNDDCNNYIETWRCKMAPLDSSASFIIKHNPTLEKEIGETLCMNGNNDGTKPCPLIGMVSHFGSTNESAGLELAVNAKISGPLIYSSGGWFIRFTEGTPRTLTLTSLQIYAQDILLLAIPYPAGTTFNLTYNAPSWCNSANSDCVHPYHQVNSVEEVVNAYGDAYHWSEKDRTLYFRMVYAAENFGAKGKGEPIWEPSMVPLALNFSRGGRTLTAASSTVVTVKAMNCDTNPCRPQQDVNIPPALRPGHTSSSTTAATADATTVASTTTGPGNDMDSSSSATSICLLVCLLLAFFVVA